MRALRPALKESLEGGLLSSAQREGCCPLPRGRDAVLCPEGGTLSSAQREGCCHLVDEGAEPGPVWRIQDHLGPPRPDPGPPGTLDQTRSQQQAGGRSGGSRTTWDPPDQTQDHLGPPRPDPGPPGTLDQTRSQQQAGGWGRGPAQLNEPNGVTRPR
ncbi:unnamed protein product [Boreogadus saida]